MAGGGGSPEFTFKSLVMVMALFLIIPVAITAFVPSSGGEYGEAIDDLEDSFRDFTGSSPSKEAVWCLTGIYTPYEGGVWGYTPDGWLYGQRIVNYSPSQLETLAWESQSYTVSRGGDGVYTYTETPTGQTGVSVGDTYTNVTFDVEQKSDVFFTTSGKNEVDGMFYYEFSGYRYAFAPLKNYTGVDSDGNAVDIVADETSLSLIWYEYATTSGVAGQLILGTDAGLAYITSGQIIDALNASTNTAKFQMEFNGLDVNVYIRINAYALAQGLSIEEAYNAGLWSVMITSLSTDIDAYTSANSTFNIYQIWDTVVALLSFDLGSYFALEGWMAMLLPAVYMILIYGSLISIGLEHQWVLLLAGLVAVVQGLSFLNIF